MEKDLLLNIISGKNIYAFRVYHFFHVSKRFIYLALWPGVLFSFSSIAHAGAHDPFSVGYSMGNNGAIIQKNGPTGRQPWIPAAFYADTLRFGVAVCGIDYYDAMDNLEASHIVQVISGAWYARHRFIAKISYAYFNALDLYNEQQGFISIGCKAYKALSASIDITAYRSGLTDVSADHEKFVHAGASMFVCSKFAAFSISCNHLSLRKASSPGFEPYQSLCMGLHTIAHPYGAQGFLCEITKENDYAFRFSLGESYCISDRIAVCGALSTNPFMVHFGLSFSDAARGVAISFVNNPTLGWSKGVTMDYAHR